MKELLRDIKYNRLPVEVLLLISYLNDDSRIIIHQLLKTEKRICDDFGKTLFTININRKVIIYYTSNITSSIKRIYSEKSLENYTYIDFIKLAITSSNYQDYKII